MNLKVVVLHLEYFIPFCFLIEEIICVSKCQEETKFCCRNLTRIFFAPDDIEVPRQEFIVWKGCVN